MITQEQMFNDIRVLPKVWEEIAKNDFHFFMLLQGEGTWKSAPHLKILCDYLQKVSEGEIKRLIVQLPPRHGKSEVASKKFGAWHLSNNPNDEIILGSYGAELAADHSVICLDTFREWGEKLSGLKVDPRRSSKDNWGPQGKRGGMKSVGVGGPMTGRGARILIIDDPFKNDKEAESKTIRENVWNWYRSTARTRLTKDGRIIIIQTRWHEDDLIGRIMKQSEEQGKQDEWTIVDLPAFCIDPETDLLGRKEGEALWKEEFTEAVLKDIKDDIGSYLFNALYQQRPAPPEGTLVKRSWFRYFTETPEYYILHRLEGDKRIKKEDGEIFQTCDPSAGQNDKSDFFVLSTWFKSHDNELLMLDCFRERAETTRHLSVMTSNYERWSPSRIGVENKVFGINIINDLRRHGLPVFPLKADGDKVSRFRPVSARFETGDVYFRRGASWLYDVENELITFPNGTHDDIVDTVAYAGLELVRTYRKKKKKSGGVKIVR